MSPKPPKQPRTIHETVLTNFNKTLGGRVFEKDLKEIYAMMLICLNLNSENIRSGGPKSSSPTPIGTVSRLKESLFKSNPFTFSLQNALKTMESLNVKIYLSTTTTSISYNIKPDLGLALVKRFFESKLLHSPSERTRSVLKGLVLAQPTPKGVAILRDFCFKVGMKREDYPPILNSSINTMELFSFDRDPATDKIVYSEYFLFLLFIKLFGPKPNPWSANNQPDKISILNYPSNGNEVFSFEGLRDRIGFEFEGFRKSSGEDSINTSGFELLELVKSPDSKRIKDSPHPVRGSSKPIISPFHHRYFTNPESDSHVQYYVSSSGVRLIKERLFTIDEVNVKVDYCVSGKAICQWLFDCTDILVASNCLDVGELLIKNKLLIPVGSSKLSFSSDRDSFFSLSTFGRRIVHWDIPEGVEPKKASAEHSDPSQSSDEENYDSFAEFFTKSRERSVDSSSILSFQDVLKDPGMRYLFKKHLESEFCSENLDAYLQLKTFQKNVNNLGKIFKLTKEETDTQRIKKAKQTIKKLSSNCFSLAYHIFFAYLSAESPFVLNIDSKLRAQINAIMIEADEGNNESKSLKIISTPILETSQSEDKKSKPQNLVLEEVSKTLKALTPPTSPTRNFTNFPKNKSSDPSSVPLNLRPPAPVYISDIKGPSDIVPHVIDSGLTSKAQNVIYSPMATPDSAGENSFTKTLTTLAIISTTFEGISAHIVQMMEKDSFPKFINSDLYKEATSTIEVKRINDQHNI